MKARKIWIPSVNRAELRSEAIELKIEGPSEVILQNLYSHISAGTELACIAGKESFFQIPDTPGYTAVGKVLEKGGGVEHLEVGDIVYTYGPHTEYYKIDATDRWHGVAVPLTEGMDPKLSAFTHMAGIAMTAIRTSSIELGDHVLVSGLGAIGNLAAQLAALQGAQVIASDVVESRLELARKCGIVNTVNPLKEDLEAKIRELTKDKLVSTYIDASGRSAVVAGNLDLVALNGEAILLGSPRDPFETNLTTQLQHFHNLPWCQTLKGALEFTYPTHEIEFVKHSIERNASIILELIRDGKLLIEPLLSHVIAPGDIQSAYDGLREKPEEYIGVLIDWSKE